MKPQLLWPNQVLWEWPYIRLHYLSSRIRVGRHIQWCPLWGIKGLLWSLQYACWMICLFEPSMGLPFSRWFCQLWTQRWSQPRPRPWSRSLGSTICRICSVIAHKTNRLAASRLSIVFRRGLSVWTTMVYAWKYGLSLRAAVIKVKANFFMGGYLSSAPLNARPV